MGQTDARVVVFDDANQNGVEDQGERLTASTLQNGTTTQEFMVTLSEAAHHLRAYQTDALGRTSGLSAELPVTVDRTAPAAPTLELTTDTDTGTAGDNITSVHDLTLQVRGESGARYTLYNDANRNGVMDADEWRTSGVLTGDATLVPVNVPAAQARFSSATTRTASSGLTTQCEDTCASRRLNQFSVASSSCAWLKSARPERVE